MNSAILRAETSINTAQDRVSTHKLRLATLFFVYCLSCTLANRAALAQSTCSSSVDCFVQYKTCTANWSKCGQYERAHLDAPRTHRYHQLVKQDTYSMHYDGSGYTSAPFHVDEDCGSMSYSHYNVGIGAWSSANDVDHTFTWTVLDPGHYCVPETNVWSGSLSSVQDDSDGRTRSGTKCGNCIGLTHSYGYNHQNATISFTQPDTNPPSWYWVGTTVWGCDSDGSCVGETCHQTNSQAYGPSPVSFPGPSDMYSNTVLTLANEDYVFEPGHGVDASITFHNSDEYFDQELRDAILGLMPVPPYPEGDDTWYTPPPYGAYDVLSTIAYSVIDDSHEGCSWWDDTGTAELQKMKYRFAIPNSEQIQYTVAWDLITWDTTTGQLDVEHHSCSVTGTGDPNIPAYSPEQEAQAPYWDDSRWYGGGLVMTFVDNVTVTPASLASRSPPGEGPYTLSSSVGGNCGTCSAAGSANTGNNNRWGGFSAQFSMGQSAIARSAGNLSISAPEPSPDLVTPAALNYWTNDPNVEVIMLSDQIRQMKAPQAVADIITNSAFSYEINYYLPSQITNFTGGLYEFSGSPFVTWKIENPDGATTNNRVRITETRGSDVKTYESVYTAATKTWTFGYPGNIREDTLSVSIVTNSTLVNPTYRRSGPAYTRTVIATTGIPGGPVQFKTKRVYQRLDFGEALIEETLSPDTNPKTTLYQYSPSYVAAVRSSGQPVEKVIHPDGSWEWYAYDSLGRPFRKFHSFGDLSPDGSSPPYGTPYTEYIYGDFADTVVFNSGDGGTNFPNTARAVIENQNGLRVAAHFTAITSPYTRIEVQDAAYWWTDSGNLFTTNQYFSSGPNLSRLKSSVRPDGTLQTYDYSVDATGYYQTNMTASGQPDSTFTTVIDGTTNWTIVNLSGQTVLSVTKDIATGIVLSQSSYTNFDAFGRAGRVTYLDGTHEDTQYACCGIDSATNRDGVLTQYWRDAMKRTVAQTSLGITTSNILDSVGQVLQNIRVGTNGTQIVLSQSQYDLARRLIAETNALGGVTTYGEVTNLTGGLTRTNIYPDGGTRIETYYRDGRIKQVTGTAVHPARYEYGFDAGATGDSADYGLPYTLEIKLNTDGTDTSEWTATYTDRVGRIYKTCYASSTSTTNDLSTSPYQKSWYNSKGQLWKQRDPDGVVTLFQYDAKGEPEYTAVDMDQNDSIDFGGTDRITRTVNDVVNDGGVDVRRSRSYIWTTDGTDSSLCLSTNETSTDGLRSWSITPSGISQSRTVYASGGNRYATNIAPDGSYTVSAYSDGQLISSSRFDYLNSQLSSLNYSYDAHGRMNQSTDARNGTTTFTFNNADLVASVTTPNPGTLGGSPQTTLTYYNQMLQATNVIQPDGGSVASEFLLTGEISRNYGARTYPVEYTYDYAGRMQTMKTWKNFVGNTGTAITTWNYDPYRGFLTNKAYADGKGPTYNYTAAGRLQTRLWARGTNTTYSYNNAGDLSGIAYDDGATPAIGYSYDRQGRQTTITVGTLSTASLTYSDAGQLQTETYSGGSLDGLGVTNSYDNFLRRTNLSTVGVQTRYGYDNASRLRGVSDSTNSVTYSYVANSPLVGQISFTNNGALRMVTTKNHDFLNRLSSISSQPSAIGSSAIGYSYTYNNANQRTLVRLADGSYWRFEYDSLGQVISGMKYWADQYPVAGQQFNYSFDDIGNRTSTRAGGDENGWNLRSANYGANSLNQYTNRDVPGAVDVMGLELATNSVTVNGQTPYRKGEYFRKELPINNSSAAVWTNITVSAPNETTVSGNQFVAKTAESFGYDLDGNMTNDGHWNYSWDAENRLVNMTSLSTGPAGSKLKLDFGYDWKGRRIQKLVSTNDGSAYFAHSTNIFVYDGWNLIAEFRTPNSPLRTYTWGLDLSGYLQGAGGVGGLLAIGDSTQGTGFAAYDGNGNLAAIVNATGGTLAAQYEYGPFGELLRATGPMAKANPVRFSTKYQDDETDLIYYGYRYYRASTGRWLSRDSSDKTSEMLNPYSFALNNAMINWDVNGLWPSSSYFAGFDLWGVPLTHQNANHRAIISGLSVGDWWIEDYLDTATLMVDADQSTALSYRHAMKAPNQNKAAAKALANNWVRSHIMLAESQWCNCKTKDVAAINFGLALHTVQDATSPAHHGFQTWHGLDGTWNKYLAYVHLQEENFDPGSGSHLDKATAWLLTFLKCKDSAPPLPNDFFQHLGYDVQLMAAAAFLPGEQ